MTKSISFRQGDVTLIKIPEIHGIKNFNQAKPKKGKVILAEGEVTGHAHVLESKVADLFTSRSLPSGHSVLVLNEATVKTGEFLEGKVLEHMPDKTIRFQQTDGTITRFMPDDVEIHDNGVKVQRAYAPLKHDEHDAIPVSPGTYQVIQHHTVTSRGLRSIVGD